MLADLADLNNRNLTSAFVQMAGGQPLARPFMASIHDEPRTTRRVVPTQDAHR